MNLSIETLNDGVQTFERVEYFEPHGTRDEVLIERGGETEYIEGEIVSGEDL